LAALWRAPYVSARGLTPRKEHLQKAMLAIDPKKNLYQD
jgi:hypothetical protein